MSPENINFRGEGENENPKRQSLRRFLGEFITRHFVHESDIERQGISESGLTRQSQLELTEVLNIAFENALERSKSLLTSVHKGQLPRYLSDEAKLTDVYLDELEDAIYEWTTGCSDRLAKIQQYTNYCATHTSQVSNDGRFNFVAHITHAEYHLRRHLYERFRPDLLS